MLKKLLLITAAAFAGIWTASAQVTSTPPLLQQSSSDVVIYFHADQGNQGLANLSSSAKVYAHTGVITDKSVNSTDWKYAPTWGDNSPKYEMQYVSPNLWKLNIGNIDTYYGIKAGETVKQLAFVFRSTSSSGEGKTESNGDIFMNVYPAGFQLALNSNLTNEVVQTGDVANFTVYTTNPADITIAVNGKSIGTASSKTELTASYTFGGSGNYSVTATALYNGQTHEATALNYAVPKASEAENYPGGVPRMGAVRNADGSVTFCLAAPQKKGVMLVGSWDDYKVSDTNTMKYQDYEGNRYFWMTVANLPKDTDLMYYYIVDGATKVGDPYAHLVLDPFNDSYISSTVFPNLPQYPIGKVNSVPLAIFNDKYETYDWQVTDFKRPDKDNLVIYELLFRDFTGTEGKALGDGTVKLAMQKIPYLKDLGVNAIELLPIQEFNGNNSWGYNPNFYFAPDKAYGTPDDYKAFIDECHKNGIAVILDVVFNQSDWLHPWYQMYPVGQNPFYNATAPHAYSVLNDWNQGYPLVEKQFHDMLTYWLKNYNVDGFRFDLVKGLGDNSSYANNGDNATNAYNKSRVERMARFNATIQAAAPGAFCINENLAGAQEENEMAADGELNWANVNYQGKQYAIGTNSNAALDRFYAPRDGRTWGSTVSYLESHDEQRLAYEQNVYGVSGVKGNLKVSMQRLSSAAAQMIMCPGSHMIWQFSELGNFDNTKDNTGGNNTSPKTVRWNLYDNAFRRGLYDSYRELIGLRLNHPEFYTESATKDLNIQFGVGNWSAGRSLTLKANGQEMFLLINPNVTGDITMNFNGSNFGEGNYKIASHSYDCTPQLDAAMGQVIVPANCYVVVVSKGVDLSGVDKIEAEGSDSEIITVPGAIITTDAADIYDLSGRSVARGERGSIAVAPGLYIVRTSAGIIKKVLVK